VKLQIEGRDYELTDECIGGLLSDIRGILIKSHVHLPIEIQLALTQVNSLSDDSLLQLAEALRDFGLGYYLSMTGPKRFGAMGVARWIITQAEKKFGEVAQVLRPPRRTDPVEHIASVVYPFVEKEVPRLGKALPNVTIKASTKGSDVTSIRFEYTASGQGG
jgi:hypothetical protein